MDRTNLPQVMVATAQIHSLPEVLDALVTGISQSRDVVLARIWLIDNGDVCSACRLRAECPDQANCLHLVASAGNSSDPENDYTRLDGAFRRFPLGIRKIGRVGSSGESLLLTGVRGDEEWIANPSWMRREQVRTFAAQPLIFRGEVLGVLAIFDTGLLSADDFQWLRVFADHAAVSIANARAFQEIEQLRARLEVENDHLREEFRDLFDEAPIPYVYEGLDTRFIRANRAALKTLGIQPGEVTATYGKSFVPDTPEAQSRAREMLRSIGLGIDARGVVLELRRKDNGQPLWVQWWSKPAPDGKSTRTMMVDITDRVLLEQEQSRLKAQNEYLLEEIRNSQDYGDIIGDSPALRKVMQQIQLVAPTDATVLINGESGTGKELVAHAIHENSPRKDRALIKVNCGAVPENLFESEFFGHMRGAFTGSVRDKPGRFELAEGGTLFLDEIGEIPLAMQAKLLRVLQEQEIERVGDTRTRKINVRIIAATNRDLKKEVEAGRFRQDLFYRLVVFPLEIPSLRERREDIAKLAAHFVRVTAKKMNCSPPRFTKAQAEQLTSQDWPGNIRELQNVIERAVILAQNGPLNFELPAATGNNVVPVMADPAKSPAILTREVWKRHERESIAAALKQSGGKVFGPGGAAELLNMKPTTLASRIKALGIR
jgi:formate hydrogenlyase transcriptional activator